MNLKEQDFKMSYRSDTDDLLSDFYLPALSNSVEYNRAVGFYSNSILNNLGKSIYPFILNDGQMKLICGVQFSEQDIKEINKGYKLKKKIEKKILKKTDNVTDYLESGLSNICWMIANRKLEIKVAVKTYKGNAGAGIYHEKIGIFKDKFNNVIATNGSSNETNHGYIHNFEYFDLFRSWGGEGESLRVEEKVNYFNQTWENQTNNLLILEFPKIAREKLIHAAPEEPIKNIDVSDDKITIINETNAKYKEKLEPREYQEDAINEWFKNDCKGILEMATGTGKTYTSLFAVEEYIKNNQHNSLIVICCPYTHLVDQWEESINDIFGDVEIIKCYESKSKWYSELNNLIQKLIFDNKEFGVVITTTNTGADDSFINVLSTDKVNKIVICDEVHNIGANHTKRFLQIDAQAKLGLSATPIRPYDEEGNKAIREYFGESVYKFGLKKAIDEDFLVEYNYHLSFCELNGIEYEEYKKISRKVAKLYSNNESFDEDQLLNILLKRARIVSTSLEKLRQFENILDNMNDYSNMLVYTAENPNYFKETLDILTKKGIKTLKITSEVNNETRNNIINKLERKDIECILAMRCLDEGVDIPSANKAIILSSSTNYKQYIQRRGRVLRKDESSQKEIADIYDFLVLPPEFANKTDKNLYERELKRILEFASTAKNKTQIVSDLLNFSQRNALMKNFINIFKEVEI